MWTQRLEILLGEESVQALQGKTAAVFGLGGVGSYAAESLARSGVGKLILVDFDEVSDTNRNRQIIALTSTIGMKKTEAMERRIHDINPDCEVAAYPVFVRGESLEKILAQKIDGAVDAIDVVTSKLELIRALQAHQIPFISALGMGGRLDPTQIEITTLQKTSYDRLAKAMRHIAREKGISLDFPVVFSKEEARAVTGKDPQGKTRKERNPIGSAVFVPAAAGLAAGSWLVRKMLEK